MVSQFYLTLPSNSSMNVFAGNTTAQFITKLPDVLEFDGGWEVALSGIHYPHAWYNVPRNVCKFIVYYKSSIDSTQLSMAPTIPFETWPVGNTHMTLPEGYYTSSQEVVDEIKKLVREYFSQLPPDECYGYFKCARQREKCVFHLEPDAILILNEPLAMLLGFDIRTLVGPGRYESSTMPDMDAALSSSSLYVYCDIIEHNVVGDSKVPLLRIVNVKGKHGERVHQSFTAPIYVPLQKHHFDTIEVSIMTDTGIPVPFVRGKSVVILHFRRATHSYFSI